MTKDEVASIIDHTILRIDVDYHFLEAVCFEALKYRFATVAIHPCNIGVARRWLDGSEVGITAAIAFPLGSWTSEMKVFEAKDALQKGATEIDFVINLHALKDKNYDVLKREFELMRKATKDKVVKAILEVGFLNEDEIVKACSLAAEAGMDFAKTSTGFFQKPTPDVVRLMSETLKGTQTKVKAAGGIRTAEDAKKMIEAGALRLGTSSGVQIVEGWRD
jgi:deoxyribose-phosphate aldolase